MAFDPKAGDIIRYDFLWKDEQRQGHYVGAKDRPCAVVVRTMPEKDGTRTLIVAPITHSPPAAGEPAIEIPPKLSRHLGLAGDRSWIKTLHLNTFEWRKDEVPFGITPAPSGEWTYGRLHEHLRKQLREEVREHVRMKRLQNARREDPPSPKRPSTEVRRPSTEQKRLSTKRKPPNQTQ